MRANWKEAAAYLVGTFSFIFVLNATSLSQAPSASTAPPTVVSTTIAFQHSVQIQNVDMKAANDVQILVEAPSGHSMQFLGWYWTSRPGNGRPYHAGGQVQCRAAEKSGMSVCRVAAIGVGETIVLRFRSLSVASRDVPLRIVSGYLSDKIVIEQPRESKFYGEIQANEAAGAQTVRTLIADDRAYSVDYSAEQRPSWREQLRFALEWWKALLGVRGSPDQKTIVFDKGQLALSYGSQAATFASYSDFPLKTELQSHGDARLTISSFVEAVLVSHWIFLKETQEWVVESELHITSGSPPDTNIAKELANMNRVLYAGGWEPIQDGYSYRLMNHFPQPARHWMATTYKAIQLLPFPARLDSRSYVVIDCPAGMIVDTFPRPQAQEPLLRNGLVRQRIPLGSFAFDEHPHVTVAVASMFDEIQNSPGYSFVKSKTSALMSMLFGTILGLVSSRIGTLFSRKRRQNVGFGAHWS